MYKRYLWRVSSSQDPFQVPSSLIFGHTLLSRIDLIVSFIWKTSYYWDSSEHLWFTVSAHRWAALAQATGMWHCLCGSYWCQTPLQALSGLIKLRERNHPVYGETGAPRSHDLPKDTQIITNAAESILQHHGSAFITTKLGINVEG